jgi:hypothetical protein
VATLVAIILNIGVFDAGFTHGCQVGVISGIYAAIDLRFD